MGAIPDIEKQFTVGIGGSGPIILNDGTSLIDEETFEPIR